MSFFNCTSKCSPALQSLCTHRSFRFKSHHTSVSNVLSSQPTSQTTVKGWIKALRKMKGLVFFDLDDGSSSRKLQVVVPKTSAPDNLTYGSSVEASGLLEINPQNQLELKAEKLNVLGSCNLEDGYPFLPRKSYEPEYVRQYLHLRSRTNSFSSLLRIRHQLSWSLRQHLNGNGYFEIHAPMLTSNDCEGAGETFSVRPDSASLIKTMATPELSDDEVFFKRKAYLSVSGQLQLEVMARSLSNVYSFGPVFRAENSHSRLHLSEFYMLEVEKAFLDSMDNLLKIMENMLKTVLRDLWENHREEVENYRKIMKLPDNSIIENIISKPFQILTYNEAKETLEKHLKTPLDEKEGFRKDHELLLVELNNNVPVFIVEWPAHIKPFYMKASDKDPKKVSAVDLLCPVVGELCGGSLREDNLSLLEERLQTLKLRDSLDWYLEIRKFGNVPTGGFGLGFERFLQMALGISNIKDTIPFPRSPHNCKL